VDLLWTPLWRRAVYNAKIGVFTLTRNHWPWEDKAKAFHGALLDIAAATVAARRGTPYIARVNRASSPW
jgi:hypothetical protein